MSGDYHIASALKLPLQQALEVAHLGGVVADLLAGDTVTQAFKDDVERRERGHVTRELALAEPLHEEDVKELLVQPAVKAKAP